MCLFILLIEWVLFVKEFVLGMKLFDFVKRLLLRFIVLILVFMILEFKIILFFIILDDE